MTAQYPSRRNRLLSGMSLTHCKDYWINMFKNNNNSNKEKKKRIWRGHLIDYDKFNVFFIVDSC